MIRRQTLTVVVMLGLISGAALGCAGRRSSLLMERRARGPFELERQFGTRQVVYLQPPERTVKEAGIEITARFASMTYLNRYFRNAEIFGKDAGLNPYQPENVVFYVHIANQSDKRIMIDPDQFALIDDMGIQYAYLSPDYLNALAEARVTVGQTTRMAISKAPSVYGVDVGGFTANLIPQSQKRLALLKQVSLSKGAIFPNVIYDGFICFIRPHKDAKHLRLVLSNIKTDFDPADVPKRSADAVFEFDATQAIVPSAPPAVKMASPASTPSTEVPTPLPSPAAGTLQMTEPTPETPATATPKTNISPKRSPTKK